MRILSYDSDDLYDYCKKNRLFSFDYSDKYSWLKDIEKVIKSIPSFLKDVDDLESFSYKSFEDVKLIHIKKLYELVYMTESSNHPFLYKTMKLNLPFRCLTILYSIYVKLSLELKKELPKNIKFLNFSFRAYAVDSMVLILGPIHLKEDFLDEKIKIEYIVRLKNFFSIKGHTYDLINLLNQRESVLLSDFETKSDRLHATFKYTFCFEQTHQYEKKELRLLAAYCIDLNKNGRKESKDIDKKSFYEYRKNRKYTEVISRIKSKKTAREFESIDLFNNLIFKHVDFDKFTSDAMGFLKAKLQADTYIFNRYYQHNKTYKLQAQKNLNPKYKDSIECVIDKMNSDKLYRKSTISHQIVTGYYEDKKPINLIDDFDKHDIVQMFDNSPKVQSALSIPLIFDNRIFAIIHFLGFSKYQFDEIDQRFLLKHAPIISRRYIENVFDENLSHITKLLEGFESKISNQKSLTNKITQICEDITKIFSCDGVALWINKKEVFHTQKELDEATLEAEINFLEDGEDDRYPFDINGEDCLFFNFNKRDIIVINSIEDECSMSRNENFYMPYKDKFIQKGITSFIAVAIKNYQGKLTGTLVIFDKDSREYADHTQSMVQRVALHLGAILNTISAVRYQTQQNDERSLHESAQYLNMIDSRAKDLESRLKDIYFPTRYDKQSVFLNIEDIKDYAAYTKSFLFGLFQHGKFTKKYDSLLKKDIKNVQQCKEFIEVKQVVIQVLVANKKHMNQDLDITYSNELKLKTEVKLPKLELHNVISNIIKNAIKYGQHGSYIKITEDINSHYYNLYIENIGHIIHSHEVDRIFTKGYRGRVIKNDFFDKKEFKESLSENKGLGLYYAKSLSKSWKGNVKLVKSIPKGKSGFAKNQFLIKIPIRIVKEKV